MPAAHRKARRHHGLGLSAFMGQLLADLKQTEDNSGVTGVGQKQRVQLYPKVALAAMTAGEARLYRLLAIAKSLDSTGDRRVQVQELRDFVISHGFMSWRTLKHTLLEGEGRYWHMPGRGEKGRGTLYLVGIHKLARRLGVPKGPWVTVPLGDLLTIGQARATFAKAYLSVIANGRGEACISQSTLARRCGVARQTINGYLKGVQRSGQVIGSARPTSYVTEERKRCGWSFYKTLDSEDILVARNFVSCYAAPYGHGRRKAGYENGAWTMLFLSVAKDGPQAIAGALASMARPEQRVFVDTGRTTRDTDVRSRRRVLEEWTRIHGVLVGSLQDSKAAWQAVSA